MTISPRTSGLMHPRWDGRRALFEIEDRGQRYACAISIGALQELSGHRHVKPAELLRCFAEARSRIEAIALAKLHARKSGLLGLLSIWTDDVDGVPPAGTPAAAQQVQAMTGTSG